MAKLTMQPPRLTTLDTRIAQPPPKIADAFYSSAEWMALRDQVRREARWMCQVPGCTNRGHTVDHIVELKDGGAPLDRANLNLKCSACHQKKTVAERAKRIAKPYN